MRADGFFCNLDVLYGGLGIGKFTKLYPTQFSSKKIWIRIQTGIRHKMLDPDPYPYQMNTDPKPCLKSSSSLAWSVPTGTPCWCPFHSPSSRRRPSHRRTAREDRRHHRRRRLSGTPATRHPDWRPEWESGAAAADGRAGRGAAWCCDTR